ncbi:hypothetical protein ACSSS7_000429 [Eimeria intestinalis]
METSAQLQHLLELLQQPRELSSIELLEQQPPPPETSEKEQEFSYKKAARGTSARVGRYEECVCQLYVHRNSSSGSRQQQQTAATGGAAEAIAAAPVQADSSSSSIQQAAGSAETARSSCSRHRQQQQTAADSSSSSSGESAAMEKYRVFADETTGCHPFVPTYYNYRRLRIRPPSQRPPAPYSSFLSLAAGGPREAGGAPLGGGHHPSRGFGGPSRTPVCFASFTSFAEPLYLQMRLNPIFVGLHADGSLSILGFWGAIKHSFSFEVNSPLRHLLLLLLQPRQCMRCIWVSPEDVLTSQQQQQQQGDELQCLRTIFLRAVPGLIGKLLQKLLLQQPSLKLVLFSPTTGRSGACFYHNTKVNEEGPPEGPPLTGNPYGAPIDKGPPRGPPIDRGPP